MKFIKPVLEIILFESDDIIATSGNDEENNPGGKDDMDD